MEVVKIGCCGFAGRRETYFRKYPVIEVEQTFYDPPRVFTAEKWRREAAEPFEFTVKAWQLITHEASSPTYRRMQTRLSPPEMEGAGHFKPSDVVWMGWQKTREIAFALNARTVLFQCPGSFGPTPEHQDNLRQFFRRVKQEEQETGHEFVRVWEPRGEWPAETVRALCEELGLVHAVDPFVQIPVTARACYFRLHGIRGYRHHYSDEELTRLRDMLTPFETGYCLFNNLHMRENASRLTWLVREANPAPEAEEQPAAHG